MAQSLTSSVLPVLRNLPSGFPREPLLPGLKRRPFNPWPLLFLAALIVFVAVALWQLSQQEFGATEQTRATASGRVTQVERIDGNVSGTTQQVFVKYRFMAGNELVYGNEIVQSQDVAPAIGDRISVSYAPNAPQDNYRALPERSRASEQLMTRIALIVVPPAVFVWLAFMFFLFSPTTPRDWLAWRRARGLYRKGELASGRVQFVRPTGALRSPNGRDSFEIVATYKVEGVRFVATTRCDNVWLALQLAPETEVVVAHDPLKPERSVILEPYAF